MDALTTFLATLLPILLRALTFAKVALGLGFVIFIHELGHFVMAKWAGVKVEKFSIGFGPTLLGFRRGETEYVIAALPLGGFVKMLGEGVEGEDTKSNDPRAYPNKSVGARMAIISAGVIMNIILGFICFAYVYGSGTKIMPAGVGGVAAGSPAYEAGLRTGDDIVSIDGRTDPTFQNLQTKVALSGTGQVVHFGVRRPGLDQQLGFDIQPLRRPNGDLPTIGIVPSASLDVGAFRPPAGMVNPPTFPTPDAKEALTRATKLVSVAAPGQPPIPLTSVAQYHHVLCQNLDKPLVHAFEVRHESDTQSEPAPVDSRFELTLPPARFLDFGFQFAAEPITQVVHGSPAEKAGIRKGDKIVKFKNEAFDPLRLPTLCLQSAGKPVTIDVDRTGQDGKPKTLSLTVTPDDSPIWCAPDVELMELDVAGLGVSMKVVPKIVSVKPGSPADGARLKAGDVINSVILHPAKEPEQAKAGAGAPAKPPEKPITIDLENSKYSWLNIFANIQEAPLARVEVVVNHASKPTTVNPAIDPTWYFPGRGLLFRGLLRDLPPQNLAGTFRRAVDDTVENILGFYATLRGLFTSRVSPTKLGGIISIVGAAESHASLGFTYLVDFLGKLSISLAVLNFLPIPPLDGGQMSFLIAEKVRGRPLPESALSSVTIVGFVLVIALVLFVTYQDIYKLIAGYFFPTP